MVTNSKNSKVFLGNSFSHISQQPDTLTVRDSVRTALLPIDTIVTPSDINPVFLEIERKSVEIKEQKLREAKALAPTRNYQITKVDTTCYLCPQGGIVPLHSIIERKQIAENPFIETTLYNKEYYKTFIGAKGPVFIETERTPEKTFTESITVKPKVPKTSAQDWIIFPSFLILLLLAYIKIFYSNSISSLFRGGIFYFIAGRLTKESSLLWNRLFILLDSLFFITIPLSISLAMDHLELTPEDLTPFKIFILSLAVLLAFRLFRFVSIKTIGLISNKQKDLYHLYFNILLYTRIISVLLAPVVVLLVYINQSLTAALLVFSAAVVVIAIVYRTLRTLQVFINKGFSLFYLILYLCALEIIPILLLAKTIY